MASPPVADVNSVYARGRKLVATLEFQLQQLEDGLSADDSVDALAANLNRLFAEVSALDRLVDASPADRGRDDVWRKRAAALAADAKTQRESVERYLKTTYAVKKEARERGLLFGGAAVRFFERKGPSRDLRLAAVPHARDRRRPSLTHPHPLPPKGARGRRGCRCLRPGAIIPPRIPLCSRRRYKCRECAHVLA